MKLLPRLVTVVIFLSCNCLAGDRDYRFIECPFEIRQVPVVETQRPDIIDDKHHENLPTIDKAEPGNSPAETLQETRCKVIRVADGQNRGEVVFTSTFLNRNNFSHTTPVVLLDGLSISADRILLLLVDNAKPFAPIVLLKMIKTPEGWREELRQEVVSMYVNYMEKSGGELKYELVPTERNEDMRVVAKRMPDGKVEFDEVFNTSRQ